MTNAPQPKLDYLSPAGPDDGGSSKLTKKDRLAVLAQASWLCPFSLLVGGLFESRSLLVVGLGLILCGFVVSAMALAVSRKDPFVATIGLIINGGVAAGLLWLLGRR